MFHGLIRRLILIYRELLILENPLSTMLHITKKEILFMIEEMGYALDNSSGFYLETNF